MLIEIQKIEVYFRMSRDLPKYRHVRRKFWSIIHWFLGLKLV